MTRILAVAALAALALAVAGCGGGSAFVPAPPPGTPDGSIEIPAPMTSVVLIFNHGSTQEFEADGCRPQGWTTPAVVAGLSDREVAGRRIVVYGYCTPAKVGAYRHQDRAGEPKVIKRTKDIEGLVRDFQAVGVPARHLFVIGHSAGGWASLLVLRRANVAVNAAIAFAPAFAGRRAGRAPGWQWLHDQQVGYLDGASRLDALVFAFDGDAFNRPRDLAFLAGITGVTFVPLSSTVIDGVPCTGRSAHRTSFATCFAETQTQRILRFIRNRL